jgi:hypothetical protein
MTLAEAEAVRKSQDSFLQIAAISDLLTLSTDPAISKIGLLSLSGLWSYEHTIFDTSLGPAWSRIQACMNREAEALASISYISLPRQDYDTLIRGGLHPLMNCNGTRTWLTRHIAAFDLLHWTFALVAKDTMLPRKARQIATDHLFASIIRTPIDDLKKTHAYDLLEIRNLACARQSSLDPDIEVIV